MDCLRYICQEVPYSFVDLKRASYATYLKFFEAQKKNEPIEKALSFREMLDIINKENVEESIAASKKQYAGGYTIC